MREKFSLVGVDGNAFNIMAYVNYPPPKGGGLQAQAHLH